MKGVLVAVLVLLASLTGAFFAFDYFDPLPAPPANNATVVVAADGLPLYIKAGAQGTWRYPVTARQVSPYFIQALIATRDPGFRHNIGIRPLALVRAAWNEMLHGYHGDVSTLTMKVANLIEPQPKTLTGRLKLIVRALQLTLHDSKTQVLDLYLNLSPFGGPIYGVQAASYAYFDQPANQLTRAQAALLVALPSAPTRLRPDLHPQAARAARDRVLSHMAASGEWTRFAVDQARQAPLPQHFNPYPNRAPLLGRRLIARAQQAGQVPAVIHTTLDGALQQRIDTLFADLGQQLPPATSAAVLVMDNRTLAVRAYRGSAAYPQKGHFAFVDMTDKARPVGTALAPFVYGFAIDDGLIDSGSLLADVPRAFGDYIPPPTNKRFLGPVSAADAIKRGLNIPATQVLAHLRPQTFVSRLRSGGIPLHLTGGGSADLSVLNEGAKASLSDLVRAYSALGRGGMAGAPRLTTNQPEQQRRLLSPGAAWIVRTLLAAKTPPDNGQQYPTLSADHRLAWARGHSSGGRDLWALGVSGKYTIGVWIGRPDGTAIPPYYKPVSPVPMLYKAAAAVPDQGGWSADDNRPHSVAQKDICWPLGLPPDPDHTNLCQKRVNAWTLNGRTPPTLRAPNSPRPAGVLHFQINPVTGQRVAANCTVSSRAERQIAQWPLMLEPWLSRELMRASTPPQWDPACPPEPPPPDDVLHITGAPPHDLIKPAQGGGASFIVLNATGGKGVLFWMVNGQLIWTTGPNEAFSYRVPGPGTYTVTVMDARGANDQVTIDAVNRH